LGWGFQTYPRIPVFGALWATCGSRLYLGAGSGWQQSRQN
jgi:hypothetical protein